MYAKVISCNVMGIRGIKTYVEADSSNGFPGFVMVGNLASSVKEASDRVRTALKTCKIYLPSKKVTINIAPADIRKDGTGYDLPICIAILKSLNIINNNIIDDYAFIGELNLDGKLVGVSGILSMVTELKKEGMKGVFVPRDNDEEARLVEGIDVVSCDNLKEIILGLKDKNAINIKKKIIKHNENKEEIEKLDFSDISGQNYLKRAVEVAVAGYHNILISGSAGTGKTMIAKRIPSIMPDLTREEAIEITKVYSIAGKLRSGGRLINKRPFRSPHHSIPLNSLIGGGQYPLPGEISLASEGVLFLDELPLFPKSCIETLREPLEEKCINITRLRGTYEYPAKFMLVGAMNPCPCGHFPDRNKCKCKITDIRRYQKSISKPLLDRIDICAESSMIDYKDLTSDNKEESSIDIKKRVEKARDIQKDRFKLYKNIRYNSEMTSKEIKKFCKIDKEDDEYLKKIYKMKKLSARALHKILKVARTIADIDGSIDIKREHLVEAVSYRSVEERWFLDEEG